jgi:hypothetical protein
MAKVELDLELLKNMHKSLTVNDDCYRNTVIYDEVEKLILSSLTEEHKVNQESEIKSSTFKPTIETLSEALLTHLEAIQDFRKRIEKLERLANQTSLKLTMDL